MVIIADFATFAPSITITPIMKIIRRTLQAEIESRLRPNKAILLYGTRRVGKTMLCKAVASNYEGRVQMLNGEDMDVQVMLSNRTIANYRQLFSGLDLLIIDEAQNIPEIGLAIKLIIDEIEGISVLATGSSSFDLHNRAGFPLVGRSSLLTLAPLSQQEIQQDESPFETRGNLEARLICGSYPEVVGLERHDERAEYLRDLVNAYLLKDILSIDGLRNSAKMHKLLQLVAFQVGSEVSYEELGQQLGLSRDTVEKYMTLLSQVFIIYRLGAFSRNLRKEVSKAGKWYFLDNGVRNALIGDFKPLNARNDAGVLWENYMISEMLKKNYHGVGHASHYFWRTYDRQEIELITESDGTMKAYEFKWGKKTPRLPKAFSEAYPKASFAVICPENYLDFIK